MEVDTGRCVGCFERMFYKKRHESALTFYDTVQGAIILPAVTNRALSDQFQFRWEEPGKWQLVLSVNQFRAYR
jgi:hypothetical protein